jgi:hypothetical protein
MAESRIVPPELAARLHDELTRLHAARALNPKHGTRAGPPQCAEDCQICLAEIQLDLLIDRIPRG